jgi:predicted CopG family antitoxin
MPKIEKVDTTHIRIETELKARLDALATGNESARDVIRRLLNWYEAEEKGISTVQEEVTPVTLADIRQIIREELTALTPVNRLNNDVPGEVVTPVTEEVNDPLPTVNTHSTVRKSEEESTLTEVSSECHDDSKGLWKRSDDITGMIALKVAISEYTGMELSSDGHDKQTYDKVAAMIRRACKAGKITKGPLIGRDSYINADEFRIWVASNPYKESKISE